LFYRIGTESIILFSDNVVTSTPFKVQNYMANSSDKPGLFRTIQTASAATCILLALAWISPAQNNTATGWELLVNNKPFEAQKVFTGNTASSDGKIAGEAYRGLAFAAKFLGEQDSTPLYLFKSFQCDKDTLLLNAAWINVLSFGRDWIGHTYKDGYKVLKLLIQQPGAFSGEYRAMLVDRLLNDGKCAKAKKIADEMGIVRSFQMIGPFDNISGSGYKKTYPPEEEIDFNKKYPGKDGTETAWFPFYNSSANGWVFTEYNFSSLSSILYYYANIRSANEQFVTLGFGASGSFKVFLNGAVVLADSIFRNTGTDMFVQKVRLFKGDNRLLIKIGHENKSSNFLVRFADESGKSLSSVSFDTAAGSYTKETVLPKRLAPSPQTEKIEAGLLERLDQNPRDLQAAILLMDYYNASELTDAGQKLARNMLKQFPESSLWHSLYSESLVRSHKITESETALNTSFRLCKYNFYAWQNELEILANSAGTGDVMDFISRSHTAFQNSPQALLFKFAHYTKIENQTEAQAMLERLEQKYLHMDIIANLLAGLYIEQGNVKKAEAILKKFLKWERTSTDLYAALANMYLTMGQKSKAIDTYKESLKYSPNSPGFYYYLAKLSLQYKEYTRAKEYIDAALAITPASSTMIALKGTILNAEGKTGLAKEAFEQSILYRYNNFDAWEQLLPLTGKPELSSLSSVPVPDSLVSEAKSWKDLSSENGAILAFNKDIFLYPSRCSKERHFIMAHLPTQNAIDIWKEYSIGYNGHYQVLNVTRAYSKNASGKETPADVSSNTVVFKTLQPGDYIVLEWTIENYYKQEMAKQVWGQHDFDLAYPVFKTELRLVTPEEDTIPYTVCGDSITISRRSVEGFRVTAFSKKSYKNPPREAYPLIDPPIEEKVHYSTFGKWSDIANWYLNLTENKLEQTFELKSLADSLLAGIQSPQEKITRIHRYLTNAIRYSFVPFRQSAWIPQPAREVLASKIGDCKDMSSLGKSLLDYAGIESNLVLVNTRDVNSIYPAYIGPNFNHCILSYTLEGTTRFIDLTDNNLAAKSLPRGDQGAVALIIKKDNDSIIHLPLDTPPDRKCVRTLTATLDTGGTLFQKVETLKTGVFAGNMRANYRFTSAEEQKKDLKKVLDKSFPNAVIDSFAIDDLDSLNDTIRYRYTYTAKNAVQFSGNTALLALNLPDIITAGSYPAEENRTYPIDMTHTWFGIGDFGIEGTLNLPQKWRLINKQDNISFSGDWGTYSLSIKQIKNTITFTRKASFNFKEPVGADKANELKRVLTQITQADNIQLMFYTD